MRAPTGDRKSVVGDSRPEQRHPSIMVVRIAPWESGGQTAATASDRSDHRPGGRRPASGTKQQYAEGIPAGRDGVPSPGASVRTPAVYRQDDQQHGDDAEADESQLDGGHIVSVDPVAVWL